MRRVNLSRVRINDSRRSLGIRRAHMQLHIRGNDVSPAACVPDCALEVPQFSLDVVKLGS